MKNSEFSFDKHPITTLLTDSVTSLFATSPENHFTLDFVGRRWRERSRAEFVSGDMFVLNDVVCCKESMPIGKQLVADNM